MRLFTGAQGLHDYMGIFVLTTRQLMRNRRLSIGAHFGALSSETPRQMAIYVQHAQCAPYRAAIENVSPEPTEARPCASPRHCLAAHVDPDRLQSPQQY